MQRQSYDNWMSYKFLQEVGKVFILFTFIFSIFEI